MRPNRPANRRIEEYLSRESDDDEAVETVNLKQKPVIKLNEWIHSFKPHNSQNIKSHILSFLLSQGLFDVAKTFSEQAGIPMPKVNETMIRERYEIKNLIRKGEIEQALQKIRAIDSNFEKNPLNNEVVFSLKCLKVINLIRQGNIEASIEAAKVQLLPFTKKDERFIKQTEKVMGLLAFVNVEDCPNKDLVKYQHSAKIASKVNKHLLQYRHEQNDQALQALLKLGKWCENRLSNFISFPKINLNSETELFCEP